MEILLSVLLVLVIFNIVITFLYKEKSQNQDLSPWFSAFDKALARIEQNLKDDLRTNRQENLRALTENRIELTNTLSDFRKELSDILKSLNDQAKKENQQLRETMVQSLKDFQEVFDRNVKSFNDLQREKFGQLENRQTELLHSTETKLEKMREMVDEKLQKTLNERLGQSFQLVTKQLESVQQGLGEMQTLAQDVGGLKKVLSNVKTRGTLGEIRLGNILEQILAPEQYEVNVKTKKGSSEVVEYAIKLPGKDEGISQVYLPLDSKFPTEAYHQLYEAYDAGDAAMVERQSKYLETCIKKCAKDISEKYLDPPNTTDFGIMFLPVEGLYAEVVRRPSLIEQLQRDYKIVIAGPTTLAAILNSLQMGFKTLAIQKRSSEVWKILGAVKTEFNKFSGMLQKAKKNLDTASTQLDEVIGVRTKTLERKLREVEALPIVETEKLPGENLKEIEEETEN